jgi:hypothetical protein
MKLNHITNVTVQQFGEARLVRHQNGRHELIGGSASDHTAAKEWVSLFAHEIVLSSSSRGPKRNWRNRKQPFSPRF